MQLIGSYKVHTCLPVNQLEFFICIADGRAFVDRVAAIGVCGCCTQVPWVPLLALALLVQTSVVAWPMHHVRDDRVVQARVQVLVRQFCTHYLIIVLRGPGLVGLVQYDQQMSMRQSPGWKTNSQWTSTEPYTIVVQKKWM
jgi:hypothetical protein